MILHLLQKNHLLKSSIILGDYLISSFNFLMRNIAADPMFSINPPSMIPTYESQLIGAVKKYIIVTDNIVIPAIISKYATNFVIDTVCSRSTIYKENWA